MTVCFLRAAIASAAFAVLPLAGAASTPPAPSAGRPPAPKPAAQAVPPGHPETSAAPALPDALADAPPAAPADVAAPQAVVKAYYDSVSGPAGRARDWGRFASLFMPGATFATPRVVAGKETIIRLTVEQFIDANARYFTQSGYRERPIGLRIESFGAVAHALSAYEARRGGEHVAPYLRGVNSFQLIRSGDRWWIASVAWDYERPDGPTIPQTLLDAPATAP